MSVDGWVGPSAAARPATTSSYSPCTNAYLDAAGISLVASAWCISLVHQPGAISMLLCTWLYGGTVLACRGPLLGLKLLKRVRQLRRVAAWPQLRSLGCFSDWLVWRQDGATQNREWSRGAS